LAGKFCAVEALSELKLQKKQHEANEWQSDCLIRETKAAWGCRTPRRLREFQSATISARLWSAAALCRFALSSLGGSISSHADPTNLS
jgi:hypothetical protein